MVCCSQRNWYYGGLTTTNFWSRGASIPIREIVTLSIDNSVNRKVNKYSQIVKLAQDNKPDRSKVTLVRVVREALCEEVKFGLRLKHWEREFQIMAQQVQSLDAGVHMEHAASCSKEKPFLCSQHFWHWHHMGGFPPHRSYSDTNYLELVRAHRLRAPAPKIATLQLLYKCGPQVTRAFVWLGYKLKCPWHSSDVW